MYFVSRVMAVSQGLIVVWWLDFWGLAYATLVWCEKLCHLWLGLLSLSRECSLLVGPLMVWCKFFMPYREWCLFQFLCLGSSLCLH